MIKTTATVSASDIRNLKRKLNEIEPELKRKFVSRIKKIGAEAAKPIKSAIRRIDPLSGMKFNYGATGWGRGKPIDSTSIRSKMSSGRSLTTSLLSIRLNSAAVSIADMAGRSKAYVGQGKRRSGFTPVVRRTASGDLIAYARATTVEAGMKFIANLNAMDGVVKAGASRIAWPTVEKDLPRIEKDVDDVIDEYTREANRKFD
jgi:hypothetical protein